VDVKEIALCRSVDHASWIGDWLDILIEGCVIVLLGGALTTPLLYVNFRELMSGWLVDARLCGAIPD
jgi:hypothetical protein